MKIAIIGATGNAGSRILEEALRRGHQVTALVRDPSKLKPRAGLAIKRADVANASELTQSLKGHEVVISSFNPSRGSATYAQDALSGNQSIFRSTEKAGVPRYLIVGGAGSLQVADGVQLVDTPNFPTEYKVEASAMRDMLTFLQKEANLDWVFMAPAAFFAPGTRTGQFRVGGDFLLTDDKKQSAISMEDYAIAMVDEVEKPRHHRQRFTVAY